jgi:monomeric isocitrate dehydrogenase
MVESELTTRIHVANQMPSHDGANKQTHPFVPDATYSDVFSATGSISKP